MQTIRKNRNSMQIAKLVNLDKIMDKRELAA